MTKLYFSCFLLCCSALLLGQSLSQILEQVKGNNATLRALRLQSAADEKGVGTVGKLTNPTLSMGWGVLPPETRLGAQQFTVGASQNFPWFGTLKSQSQKQKMLSRMSFARAEEVELNILAETKIAYYNLLLTDRKKTIIQNKLRIYKSLLGVSTSQVAAGKGLSSDVLQIQVKLQDLTYQIASQDRSKLIYQAQINALRNSDTNRPILVEDTTLDAAVIRMEDSYYSGGLLPSHPTFTKLKNARLASEEAQTINKRLGLPAFGVGVEYRVIHPRQDVSILENGRDIFIPKLSLSIPLYRSKYKAKHEEEQLRQRAILAEKQQVTNMMIAKLRTYHQQYEDLLQSIVVLKQQIRVIQSAYSILLAFYSSEGNRFDELIRTQGMLFEYKLKLVEAYVKTHILKAKWETILY